MIKHQKIGLITSGGDCGGLNAVIKGAGQMALQNGLEAYLIPSGYAGLYNLVDKDRLVKLDAARLDAISSYLAGSVAGHSRVKIAKIPDPDRYGRIKAGLDKFAIDGLVIAGGDDTGSVVVDLHQHHIPCVHVPKTMDLDLQTYSAGGDSAVNRIARYVEEVKTTGRSHNRIMIVEVFGRYSGQTVLRGGVGGDADCILLPEILVDFDLVYDHLKQTYMRRIRESDTASATYTIVVTEGLRDSTGQHTVDDTVAIDAFGHKKLGGSGKYVREQLSWRIKNDPDITALMKQMGLYVVDMNAAPEIRETAPGYLIRSGTSSAYDVNFGREAGAGAVLLLVNGITGVTVTHVAAGKVYYAATDRVIQARHVDEQTIAFYEALGLCFGRRPAPYRPEFERVEVVRSNYF